MGGKSKLLDAHKLESLYSHSRDYEQQILSGMQSIQKQLVSLSELSIQQPGGSTRSQMLRAAVMQASDAIERLKANCDQTKRFIDAKLAGAVSVAPIRPGKSSSVLNSSPSSTIPADIRLKK